MNKQYRDQSGNVWERFDNEFVKEPSYPIPANIPQKINNAIVSWVDPLFSDHTFQLVPLTVFSVPMWIQQEDCISSPLHYSYCVCYSCGRFAAGPVQICALLLICKYTDNTFSFTKRAVVRCIRCNPNMLLSCSYFGFILISQRCLNGALNYGWNTFTPEYMHANDSHCYVCGKETTQPTCATKECTDEYNLIVSVAGDPYRVPETNECMQDFLWHCHAQRLDVISEFLNHICYNPICRRAIRPRTIAYSCDQCCRVLYCSEKCLEQHVNSPLECVPLEQLWLSCLC